MRIGDKVRMLHDSIEGVVIKIIDEKQVEIEDTFGFNFPVLKRDLIVVNPIEDQFFNKNNTTDFDASSSSSNISKKYGYLQLAIIEEHKNFGIYLLNQTNFESFTVIYAFDGTNYELLDKSIMKPNSKLRLALVPLSKIETWKSLYCVTHDLATSSEKPKTKEVSLNIKASKLFQEKAEIGMLNTKGYLRDLNNEQVVFDKYDLEREIDKNTKHTETKVSTVAKPAQEVDLHSESLGLSKSLSNSEILKKQLDVFRKSLESAIVHKMKEIIFIHGIGKGVLSAEIQKSLKEYPEVKFFEDAQKSKFGYGATKVTLK